MIDLNIETTPALYFDYKAGLDLLRDTKEENYEYPEEVTLFHMYTEFRTHKELLALKSYLATQNLTKTKLIVWSDYDISEQENIQPYKDIVDFRVYNLKELAIGTPLEGVETYLETGEDHNHWMSSGVMRFLVLYKFGGIYFDMDMVLLRDFKPILGQDFAYQWGTSTDFAKEHISVEDSYGPCAAMLGVVKGSQFIEDCMERLVVTPPEGGTCYDEDMLGRVYAKRPFTVFPSTFFNTEWAFQAVDKDLNAEIQKSWFDHSLKDPNHLFLEAFAWHWHNSSNKGKKVVKDSKFDRLDILTTARLKERGLV